jgi:PBP1b-binding outer membrane lipoprotein LpoB
MQPTKSPAINSSIACFRSIVTLLLGVSVLLSGCVSMQNAPVPTAGQPSSVVVKVGDKVEVQTRIGEMVAFKVTAIEPEALAGKDVRVLYRDILSLRVERLDKTRTTFLVVGAIVVVAGALGVAAAGSSSGGYMGF